MALRAQARRTRQDNQSQLSKALFIAAFGFSIYSLTQLFVHPIDMFPARYINEESFQSTTGFPIQLIRTIMAQAAQSHKIPPRTISFKGAIQFLEEFQRLIDYQQHRGPTHRLMLYEKLLQSIASQRVGDRPNRFEPRLLKRRPKHFAFLRKPRHVIKNEMMKGVR